MDRTTRGKLLGDLVKVLLNAETCHEELYVRLVQMNFAFSVGSLRIWEFCENRYATSRVKIERKDAAYQGRLAGTLHTIQTDEEWRRIFAV